MTRKAADTATTGGRARPAVVRAGEGEARWWLGALAVIRATAADTVGAMTVIEVTEPAGAEAPLHVHHREDEAFWVLQGDVTLRIGEMIVQAHAGDYALGPRDVPHAYRVGDAGCRMLFICTPGGFEEVVRAMSEPAGERVVPPPGTAMPDLERIAEVAGAHGVELLG